MAAGDIREASRAGWSTVAPDWEQMAGVVDRQLQAAARWMLDATAPRPGERVLDLAAGPGTMSLLASRAVGPDGTVLCTDFSEPMVEAARRRLAADGAHAVEFRVVDAESIDLPDEAVDVVLCRCGYMLMADPAAALRESARVLAPGGRLALAVWSAPEANPWAGVPMRAVLEHLGAPPPPPGAPGLWALADPDRLRGLLDGAGLRDVACETLDDTVRYASADDWLETTIRLAGPLRALVGNLDEEGREAIRRRVAEAAGAFEQPDGGLAVPERLLVASARR